MNYNFNCAIFINKPYFVLFCFNWNCTKELFRIPKFIEHKLLALPHRNLKQLIYGKSFLFYKFENNLHDITNNDL